MKAETRQRFAEMMKEVLELGAEFEDFELYCKGYTLDYQGTTDYGAGHCYVTQGSSPTVYLFNGYNEEEGLSILLRAVKGEPIEGAIDAAIAATERAIQDHKKSIEREEQELQKLRQMRGPLL